MQEQGYNVSLTKGLALQNQSIVVTRIKTKVQNLKKSFTVIERNL